MKEDLKIVALVGALMSLQACVPIQPMQARPCIPYNADVVMEWAKGVKGARSEDVGHSRSASVSNDNSRVDCKMYETASSRKGNPIPPPQQNYQYNPYNQYNPYW